MKLSTIVPYLLTTSAVLTAAEVNFVVTMEAAPGKLQQAADFFEKQTAAFRATNPPGQTVLISFPSGNTIVTIEQYVDNDAALAWTLNKTHVDGASGALPLVDIFSSKIYTDADFDLKQIFSQKLGVSGTASG